MATLTVDQMVAFKSGTDVFAPKLKVEGHDRYYDFYYAEEGGSWQLLAKGVDASKQKENNVRYIIMNYFREMKAQGKVVESKIEGRCVVDSL